MNVILVDINRESFYPLSYTRPVAEFRIGILTIKEKWEKYYKNVSVKTDQYLSKKYPLNQTKDNLWINANIFPNKQLITELKGLRKGEALKKENKLIAFRNGTYNQKKLNYIQTNTSLNSINNICDIFRKNGEEIERDFRLITKGRESMEISDSNGCLGEDIFVEKGASIEYSTLNTKEGPIYIGKDAEIMEGSSIRGPFAMCEKSVIKMNTKIYSGTTLGPFCKVGGEVSNVVLFGYSSKSHDGFLGDSVIGQWCNLGAGSNNSNLKNNYAEVKLWDYSKESFKNTGLQFCGLIMGDHSKCGINTMFNTGTVVGVSANIYGSGFHRNFIPSFSWGGRSGFTTYKKDKAYEVAKKVMNRRSVRFLEEDENILHTVFDMTKRYRND